MRSLSKSKLLAYRQCKKRLWLEIHRPELRTDSAETQAGFHAGHMVGEIARKLYDPNGKGALIDIEKEGFGTAFERSASLIGSPQPIFEAGFSAGGALAFADVMLPEEKKGAPKGWHMVEVKSSTSVKDYHRDDAAVQSFVFKEAGVPLKSVSLAHIDASWVYPGNGDYSGLLKEQDLTDEAFGRSDEVREWIAEAQQIVRKRKEPEMETGSHCDDPYECGFYGYCSSLEPQAELPVTWLPGRMGKKLKEMIEAQPGADLRDIPDELLNQQQLRVKKHSVSGKPYFDDAGAAADLAPFKPPFYFIDFETINPAVPLWKGTRPYQQVPFQFSVHRLSRTGKLEHQSFLDLSGDDPSQPFAEALIEACGEKGAVFVFNAGFEGGRMRELGERFPKLKKPLQAISERLVDLLVVARNRFYHPSQRGSWSIKKVLPAIAPELDYAKLEGVQDGGMAMAAFARAIAPETSPEERERIRLQLLEYCKLDTLAMVKLWEFFTKSAK